MNYVEVAVLVSFNLPVPGESPTEQLIDATTIVSKTVRNAFGDDVQIEFYSVEPSSAEPAA